MYIGSRIRFGILLLPTQPASKIAKLLRQSLISGSTDTKTESGPTLEGAEGMHYHNRDTMFLVTSFHSGFITGW